MATLPEGEFPSTEETEDRPVKRLRVESPKPSQHVSAQEQGWRKGVAPIKAEYMIQHSQRDGASSNVDDDAAEAAGKNDANTQRVGKRQKQRGQNKDRSFGNMKDLRGLCSTRVLQPEFSPLECSFGDRCKFEHDLRKYLREWKREDLSTLDGKCPAWQATGVCPQGWKCRFLGSHMEDVEHEDGRKELRLIQMEDPSSSNGNREEADAMGIHNGIGSDIKFELRRWRVETPKTEQFLRWLEQTEASKTQDGQPPESEVLEQDREEHRAAYTDTALRPSEKRKIYFGSETPALAPLTTQGNLPFRRLCVELGAQATYSEMAMGVSLMQGTRSEWALMKAHASEMQPPTTRSNAGAIDLGYNNNKDVRFGAQIAGNKPWNVVKATEVLTRFCPQLRVVDLNCGCPIDQVYSKGAGSALLDNPSRLEKILLGMNRVSGEVPITVKIRMGTQDKKPTAEKLVNRLVKGSPSAPATTGVAAITLHGRSRQQRYTRSADWEYIASCAALVNRYRENEAATTDTAQEADTRDRPSSGQMYFLGNGDCYSHVDYFEHIDKAKVDTVMIARGALIKPWIFEEIATGQYLDKSATERLGLVEKFVRYGLEAWGSDEIGIGHVRRFLLEWLSFTHRYIPIGILEHLPPNIQDRPPLFRGRNELETLLASANYKDWVKISEMFLGPAGDGFRFTPKHKSSSYEIQAEG